MRILIALLMLVMPAFADPPAPAPTKPPLGENSSLGGQKLGDTHHLVKDGWVWEKDANGKWKKKTKLKL